jgi:hypothetical protein
MTENEVKRLERSLQRMEQLVNMDAPREILLNEVHLAMGIVSLGTPKKGIEQTWEQDA